MSELRKQYILLESEPQFEQWLQDKIENRKIPFDTKEGEATTYKVPVVVHVIHNGENIGTGVNITEAQILSQINVLNNDFKRLNADANLTHAEFVPVAGSLDIEFVMAKRTPEGLPTNGIVRMQGTKTEWSLSDNYELKSLSYWPAEEYLNIWVTRLSSSFVGFAQFPVSGLPGLSTSSNNRLTDGIVIDHTAFGSIDDGAFNLDPNFNKGRTTTHEMGHFFGLKHIWGDDDSCAGTDHVDDTPIQATSTTGCPAGTRTSCGSNDMYQNYLDYTNDACMNIFTQGQVARMIAVLENSPRRASLLSSPALADPQPVANDLGISRIISPGSAQCELTFEPLVEVRNYGNNTVSSLQIRLLQNGNPVETRDVVLNLAPLSTTTVGFTPLSVTPGNYTFAFEILLTNGTTDGNPMDNNRSISTYVPHQTAVPFLENFNSTPAQWTITNPDLLTTWENSQAPDEDTNNRAMFLNFYDYEDGQGELDILTTPVFDLSSIPSAYLSFDVAYAQFQTRRDGLRIYVLTDCNTNLFQAPLIYDKVGSTLATAPSTNAFFIPANAGQWRKEIINLTDYVGTASIQLAFVGLSDWGNNLYLDNVAVITTAQEDLILKEIVSPSPVTCANIVSPQLKIQNAGTVLIQTFVVEYRINDGNLQIIEVNESLQPGEEKIIPIPEVTLASGVNTLLFTLAEPNNLIDINPTDNTKTSKTLVQNARRVIPWRENFDSDFTDDWSIINPEDGAVWNSVSTNFNRSVFTEGFDNTLVGDKSWLVSPVLDFSNAETASLFFDLSYSFNEPQEEKLQVLVSHDCGETFQIIAFSEAGESLSVNSSQAYWSPTASDHWKREYVNLNVLAATKEGRLAFVLTNDNGNNLYIDNLEFFASDEPDPKPVDSPFLIYGTSPGEAGNFYITFNLPESQPVGYEVVDMMGRPIVQEQIDNVLNQTFVIDAGNTATGIYIVRLRIGTSLYATKVFIRK